VNFATITLCVASQGVFIVVYFVIDSVRKLLDTPSYMSYISTQPALGGNEWSASRSGPFFTGIRPWHPLDTRLGGPQSGSGRCSEEKVILGSTGNRTPVVQPVP
jgi:hypothetical protein